MAVTIKNAQGEVKSLSEFQTPRGEKITLEQFEVFGRLRLSHHLMASYLSVPKITVGTLMRRADFRMAYERGRAETVIALRQKEVSLALAGDTKILQSATDFYGERENHNRDDEVQESKNTRSWDEAVLERAKAARDKIVAARNGG